jgi:hypothetical protein
MENEDSNLQKNVSRLVKLAGDSDRPGRGFTDSLIESALQELSVDTGTIRQDGFLRGRVDRVMGIAAMVAVLFGAAAQILLSALASSSPLLAGTLFVTMSANWLSYVGRMIL